VLQVDYNRDSSFAAAIIFLVVANMDLFYYSRKIKTNSQPDNKNYGSQINK